MKNKKGFTLVELLAVIAILAILVIIALPNVLKLFNDAKKQTFLTEAKTIYREATKKYINESVKGNTIKTISSSGEYKLNINGEQLDYCINLDSKGKVTSMKVSNGSYYIEYEGSKIEDLNIEDVKEGTIDTTTCKVEIEVVSNPCTYDGALEIGAEYTNGQYTYRYKQEESGLGWQSIDQDGWGVTLTDKYSTEPVITKLCTSINGKPIVSMSYMFYDSIETTLDLSSFDTSNVTNMTQMFYHSQATSLDLSNFNTSNVTDMSWMFSSSQATTLDLSSFDTSKVTDMSHMFDGSQATSLDLSNFNTSNVTNMNQMFRDNQATSIDLSSFDTSNVKDMNLMFMASQATTITGLNKFNTSNVTNMGGMFSASSATELDLSNFDTSKVTDMSFMFSSSSAIEIKGLETFDTSKVTNMIQMFYNSKATTLDLSSFNTSNVTDMNYMFNSSKASKIYVSSKWSTANVTDSSYMFYGTANLVGGNGTRFSWGYIDKTYARVDDPENGLPGYFTYKASPSN